MLDRRSSGRALARNPRTDLFKRRRCGPVHLDRLEDRRLLTTFVVTSNGDVPIMFGTTLRQAILAANLNPGADTIAFNITGTPTIHPLTDLPAVTGPTTIDGTTQTGWAPGAPVVFIEGTGTLPELITGNLDGLRIMGGSTIKGLIIGGFTGADSAGIRVTGNANTVAGNWIGTDTTGLVADGNSQGIVVEAATNSHIGSAATADRNVISGNFLDGILFTGAGSGNVVAGNYVGLAVPGNTPLPNTLNGINVQAAAGSETTDLLIGGTAAGAGNVVGGNANTGVLIGDVSGVHIAGNRIGANAGGTTAVPNDGNGIVINGDAANTVIGGVTAGARNVISGNNGDGIQVITSGTGTLVQGNYIGTDAGDTAALGNTGNGINVLAGSIQIGGTTAATGNVISGNEQNGLQLLDGGNVVEFNDIGTAADGVTAIPNAGNGVYIDSSDNVIGTTTAGNTIAYNGQTGVVVALSDSDVRNAIRGDNIYLNGSLGIDLGDDGVTMNDPQDPDTGPNNFQNFPVLTSVTLSGGTATISGTLNSTPNSTFAIDLFVSQIWDTTTYGEGQKYLGSTTVSTDAAGNGSFTVSLAGVPSGWNYFAATATDAIGNTSEFAYDPTPGSSGKAAAATPMPFATTVPESWTSKARHKPRDRSFDDTED